MFPLLLSSSLPPSFPASLFLCFPSAAAAMIRQLDDYLAFVGSKYYEPSEAGFSSEQVSPIPACILGQRHTGFSGLCWLPFWSCSLVYLEERLTAD